MKTTLFITLFVLSLLVCVQVATAGDLNPPAAPTAGTMKTLDEVEPRIAVNAQNTPGDATSVYKITAPGSYYLTGDVYANGKHAILINADHVTLDLMGFRLWASYATASPPANLSFDGIYIHDDGQNIEIRNGTIESPDLPSYDGFRYGIYSRFDWSVYGRYIRIFNVRVLRCRSYGINPSDFYATIQNCHVAENGDAGIVINAGVVTNCVAFQNFGTGISASGCVVTQCKSINNLSGSDGIYLGTRGVASDNSVSGNSGVGINAGASCVISRNAIGGCSGNGITAGTGCKIDNNTVSDNLIGILASDACVITGNSVSNNDDRGISAGAGATVDKNTSFGNTGHGIYTGAGSTVTNNTAYENTSSGIYTNQSTVVKNNSAYLNGGSGVYVGGYGSSVVGNTARNNQAYGIFVTSYCLVDQNATYGNNQSGGSYVNLYAGTSCEVGLNVAP